MDRNRSPACGSTNIIRLQNPISSKTSTGAIIQQKQTFRNSSLICNGSRDTKNVDQWRDSPLETRVRVPVNNVSQEKTRWNKQTNIQLETSKRLRPCTSVQTVESCPNTDRINRKLLHDKNRHFAGLLSRANSTLPPQIFVSGIRRGDLRNDVSSFRSRKCAICLCKNNKLAGSLVQTSSRCRNGCISGRLPDNASRSKCFETTNRIRSSETERIRVAGQQKEVFNRTLAMCGVPWNHMGHSKESKDAVGSKSQSNKIIVSGISDEKELELVGRKSSVGETKFCGLCGAFRKTALSSVTDRIQQVEQVNSSRKAAYVRRSTCRARLVDEEYTPKYNYSQPRSNDVHYHRRSRCRLGCNCERAKNVRKVDKFAKSMALQSEGALGTVRNLKKSGSITKGYLYYMADRQPNCGRLYNKARRDQVQETLGNRYKGFTSVRRVQLPHNSALHPRRIQRLGRQLITSKMSPGMASETNYNENNFSSIRVAGNRPVCFRKVSSCTQLHKRGSNGHQKPIHGCFQPTLALQASLGVSTTGTNTTSPSTPGKVHRNLPTCDADVAQSILDGRHKAASNTTAMGSPGITLSPSRPADKPPSCGNRQPKFANLDGTGWLKEISNWENSEVELLQCAWRTSTLKTYRPCWERWKKFANAKNIKADDPRPSDLARFLCYLHEEEKLAPRTILVHKSVVTTFANPAKSLSLSSNPIVTHAIKGIMSKRPVSKKSLAWNVEDLIRFLETYDFDTNSLFAVSRHTCVLLLLASGRRVHDLTLLNTEPGAFEDRGKELVFWPDFGSKTDSTTYRQSGWCLKESNILRFNLIHWVRQVLSLSQDRRKSKQLKNLFITTRGAVKNASRAVIAGWIVTLFKQANIKATAGSIRAGVATDNWTRKDMEIEELLKRGNWRSKHTFFNHYFREIKPTPRTASYNIGESFSPIN